MQFIKFYSVALFKLQILCKFTSFLNFLFLEAAADATAGAARQRQRRHGHLWYNSNEFIYRDIIIL
jgi:hypothetical protein